MDSTHLPTNFGNSSQSEKLSEIKQPFYVYCYIGNHDGYWKNSNNFSEEFDFMQYILHTLMQHTIAMYQR